MTLRHLKIFKQVCKDGSITKAAVSLGMTQPSVSVAVAELEQFYEAKLFDRIGKKLFLTPAGKLLEKYSGNILGLFNESVSLIRDSNVRKDLKVAMVSNFAPPILPTAVKEFRELYPEVRLENFVFGTSAVLDLLKRSAVDIAVIDDIPADNFCSSELYREDYVLLCTRELAAGLVSPVERETIGDIPFILPNTPNSTSKPMFEWIANGRSKANILMHTDGSHVMSTMSLSGLAVLPVLRKLAEDRIRNNPEMCLLEIAAPAPQKIFNLCYMKGKTVDPVMQDFMDILHRAVENR